MSVDLAKFGLSEMLRCSVEVRRVARGHPTMEAAARQIARYCYDELSDGSTGRACALVRVYKTHRFSMLPDDLRRFAKRAMKSGGSELQPFDDMRCLTLLATVGDEESWNQRHLSKGHQAIPLPSPNIVERAPMIAQLIKAFGLSLNDVVQPTPDVVRKLEGKTYGVFHIEEAKGSQYIPAQAQFVERYGIRSVVGFGGSLLTGDLFAVILFTRTHVSAAIADRFRTIALDTKGSLLTFDDSQVFDSPIPAGAAN